MGYYTENNNLHSGWSDASQGNAQVSATNSPYPGANFVSQNNWLRDYNGSATCPVAAAVPTGPQPVSNGGQKPTATNLASIATTMAAGAGESLPSDVQSFETTHGPAVRQATGGDTVQPAGEDVSLIRMHGQFTADGAPRPPGAPAPTGTVMTVVVDATTGKVTDSSLGDTQPDLAPLGTATTIK